MSINPREIPTGAVRYNTDSNKMEVYIGSTWMEVAVSSPTLDGGVRALFGGGYGDPSGPHPAMDTIDFIIVSTQGNATDFGNLTVGRSAKPGGGSRTRGIFQGGRYAQPGYNTIEFVTFSSTGNGTDFGDMINLNPSKQGFSNQTRSIFVGGYDQPSPSRVNSMEFITIAQTGNSVDFGDTVLACRWSYSGISPTR